MRIKFPIIILLAIMLIPTLVEARGFTVCKNYDMKNDQGCLGYTESVGNIWGKDEISSLSCGGDNLYNLVVFDSVDCSWAQSASTMVCDGSWNGGGSWGYVNSFKGDAVASACWQQKSAEDNAAACSTWGGGAWTGINCCYPGEFSFTENGALMCSNAGLYRCNDANNPAGKYRSGYYCWEDGLWRTTKPNAELSPSVCTTLNPNADYVTGTGCCGNNAPFNSGFEISSLFDWTAGTGFSSTSVDKHSGSNSLTSLGTTVALSTTSAITVQTGQKYTVSGWIKRTKNPVNQQVANAYIETDIGTCKATAKTFDVWEFVSCDFTAPSSTLKIRAGISSPGGQVYFDDISIIGPGLDLGNKVTVNNINSLCNFDGTSWKWSSAISSGQAYKITQVDTNHDAISNGKEWFSCNPENILQITAPSFDSSQLTKATCLGDNDPACNSVFTVGGTQPTSDGEDDTENVQSGEADSDFSVFTPVETSFQEDDGKITFIISNPQVGAGEKLKIKIDGTKLPADLSTFYLSNDASFKIMVNEGDELLPTVHASATSTAGLIGYGTPFEIELPETLSEGEHDLSVTIMKSATEAYKTIIIENAFELVQEALTPGNTPFLTNPARFLCSKENIDGSAFGKIIECDGPSYQYCINCGNKLNRISGGPTGLVKDWYDGTDGNAYLRKLLSKQITDSYEHTININDIEITNWNTYDNLEFDIFFAGSSRFKLALYATESSTTPLFDDDVIKYSTSGDRLNTWHHIKIPISALTNKDSIRKFKFHVIQSEILADVGNSRIEVSGGGKYLSSVALDRIYLSSANTKFCATDIETFFNDEESGVTYNNVGKWISDLDKDRDACDAVRSYKWTGTQCCGDDQSTSYSETFNDKNGGCWRGTYVAKDNAAELGVQI